MGLTEEFQPIGWGVSRAEAPSFPQSLQEPDFRSTVKVKPDELEGQADYSAGRTKILN